MIIKCFTDTNVYLSRNLVFPPETYAAVHDALKHHGANVLLCSDPSRSSPSDYHVISSDLHDKFDELKAKGCNLIGPRCVLSCAKENRELPKRPGFTCCLALDGVKVLASGFEKDKMVRIQKLVTAMGGFYQDKASSDVDFVIVKNVLAPMYKWALTKVKKPTVTKSWLDQCWNEHRFVPTERYRVPPFYGLTICVTRVKGDVRKVMEKLILDNGGNYAADLTRKCTHLVSEAPQGDKYKAAKLWGLRIVTPKWIDQSIARRVCLDEDSYSVQRTSMSIGHIVTGGAFKQHSQEKGNTNSLFFPSSETAAETNFSQHMSCTFSDSTSKDEGSREPTSHPGAETKIDDSVADDSQSEDNDLYLSDCRILLVGFQAAEMRRLVNMVRRGGGSRYMSFGEKLTHIVIGAPSESEQKEVRRYAALGVIYVVRTMWLEDCDRGKKEVPVSQRYIVSDLLPLKDPICSNRAAATCSPCIAQVDKPFESGLSVEKVKARKVPRKEGSGSVEEAPKCGRPDLFSSGKNQTNSQKRPYTHSQSSGFQNKRSSVFKGIVFCFSIFFPEDRRSEVVEWVDQGGGTIVDDMTKQNVQFIIECHGVTERLADVSQTTVISTHWIKSGLEAGSMPDVGSHIIYSPLRCQIPFTGFEGFRFCVSQYEDKDRLLLRNLCFVLGVKFTEVLTTKVTHLICKFSFGSKYEAACKWKIHSVTFEWISECIRQNTVVRVDSFRPKDITSQDQEAGLCTVSQYPTQAARMICGNVISRSSQSQLAGKLQTDVVGHSNSIKRVRLEEDDNSSDFLSAKSHEDVLTYKMEAMENKMSDVGEVSQDIPDVASAIEDLLAQSNKIQDMATPGSTGPDQSIFSPDRAVLFQNNVESRSTFGISKQWLSRTEKQDDICNPSGPTKNQGIYDGFSETQTDSQVVGYEEDNSGIQMMLDRVRTRSSLT